jgi:hypothetical protein
VDGSRCEAGRPLYEEMNCSSDGWLASPDGSCYKLLETKESHWRCADLCSAWNASLVCIGSAEENEFISSILQSEAKEAWIGNYQVTGSSEPAGGWDTCVNGEATSFTKWGSRAPADANGAAHCATILLCGDPGRVHHWQDDYCWSSHDCLCERGAIPSSTYLAAINDATLRGQQEDLLSHLHEQRVIIFAIIIPLLWLLPVLVSFSIRMFKQASGVSRFTLRGFTASGSAEPPTRFVLVLIPHPRTANPSVPPDGARSANRQISSPWLSRRGGRCAHA